MLESKSFPVLAQLIFRYMEGTNAKGFAAQNQLYTNLAALRQGDRSALDALVEQNMVFIRHAASSLANQYHRPLLADDLVQEGALG